MSVSSFVDGLMAKCQKQEAAIAHLQDNVEELRRALNKAQAAIFVAEEALQKVAAYDGPGAADMRQLPVGMVYARLIAAHGLRSMRLLLRQPTKDLEDT